MENTELSKRILQAIQEDSERTGQKVFHGLLDSAPVNNLPERIFRDYFLPQFLGLTTVAREQWMFEWVSIAGTPMSEVRIIDDNTGQELFLVPPVLNSNSIFMHKSEGDIGDIFTRYDQLSQNTPGGAMSFLFTALQNKNEELLKSLNNSDAVKRWLGILARYGYIQPQQQEQQQVQQNQPLDDYFDI